MRCSTDGSRVELSSCRRQPDQHDALLTTADMRVRPRELTKDATPKTRSGKASSEDQRHRPHPRRARTHRRPCRTATPDRSPLPSSGRRNRESDGGHRAMRARRRVDRRDAPLVETASVARRRQRASNQNPGLRSTHCPNTEPRQDDVALHDSQRHGCQRHGAALTRRSFLRRAAFRTGSWATLRSRLPPSRPYGSERPCRWC
jgi:hypothetical protein